MPDGGKLTLSTHREGDTVVIDIADTGEGISSEDIEHLFEPFFSKKKKGTGLGLVICKFLVDRHKGKITFTSELGKGTRFSVHLPMDPNNVKRRIPFPAP
jgi:signal transduction histidine kinase